MDLLRHIFAPAFLLAVLLCVPACDGHKDDLHEETGTLVVNISNPVELETRHATGEESDASDGGVMKTLIVWLATNGNGYQILHRAVLTPNAATATVKFTDVTRGSYYLLAVANYGSIDFAFTSDDYNVSTSAKTTTTNDGKFPDATVKSTALTDGQSPSFDDKNGMPSSYSEIISVAAGENVIDASLKRCVGRLTFNVRNNLDNYELFIHSMGLSKYNRTFGYVFDDNDHTVFDKVAFPDLPTMGDGGLVQVGHRDVNSTAANNVKTVYDIYLYETNPGMEFKFDMIAALYPKDTEKSSVTLTPVTQSDGYKLSDNASEYGTSDPYVIRSGASGTYYLGDDGNGTLTATEFTSDDDLTESTALNNYLWTFSSASSSTATATQIKNVGTGKYLYVDRNGASLESDSETVQARTSNGKLIFYLQGKKNTYYLALNSNSPGISQNTEYGWYVRSVTKVTGTETTYEFDNPVAPIPRNERIIKYIDKYGASQPLTGIGRNEHVTVNLNVFYNRELGQFNFEVLDWDPDDDDKKHETTFD